MFKVGASVVSPRNEFYSEIDALESSKFNVEDWLKEKGGDPESKLENENQRLILLSLKDIYSVPGEAKVTPYG